MEHVVPNATFATPIITADWYTKHPGLQAGVTVSYMVGILGNLLALFILHRTRSSSNQKHRFMLRCLATNDCMALTGMLIQMYVALYWPSIVDSIWACRFRVLWRFFGLGSGCVAIIMAVERWLALTKPFFYQKKPVHFQLGVPTGTESVRYSKVLGCAIIRPCPVITSAKSIKRINNNKNVVIVHVCCCSYTCHVTTTPATKSAGSRVVGHGSGAGQRHKPRRVGQPPPAAERDCDPMEQVEPNATFATPVMTAGRYTVHPGLQAGVTVSYTVGIFGNLLALFILHRTRASSNQKHGFMLRCLATNDCIALTGMLIQMYVALYWPSIVGSIWACRFRVLWRFFGLGSGCVAIIMAVERWLALTKPFFYQKHISLRLLKRIMIMLWLGVLCLVCAPFFGFGLYWDSDKSQCIRYRNAKKPLDVLYAYLYFSYGVFLCIAIVYTNTAVMKALCMKDNPHSVLMRRASRGNLTNAATREERAFGWLMFLLCVAFLICWVPQMICIPLARFVDESKIKPVSIAADLLIAMHFALDPYLYVLQHWTLVKSICLGPETRKTANGGSTSVSRSSSMRTTCEVLLEQPL
ncbi:GPCR, rhodopsin-like, 7TM,G protein-coupled receptor, rhodopsin-like [Cinara cedri]|uniref:GPCR, rhodopsin-like, 7TM,G protein-coupled receptor, rhodopsin-like n=1 Tax=Cinara cedri TaxID=506608 RepID=A0A5E4NRA4_9HEMI|nr:GPCR, rhodopsin-like, 7TM,G protein-coupled receptor, rhodopsin-like [Cinara cedri]